MPRVVSDLPYDFEKVLESCSQEKKPEKLLFLALNTRFGGKKLFEFELEVIQIQMAQKNMLREEVYARGLRASQNAVEDIWVNAPGVTQNYL